MQNPRNTMTSAPGSISPSTVKGKPAVVQGSARTSGEVGNVKIQGAHVKTGATPTVKSTSSVPAPAGVKLGTTRGNHHVAHAAGSGSGFATPTLMQGK